MSHDLFLAAKSAMTKAHVPYSNFPVGAAIRTDDGRVFAGANIENISFPEGWCAETTALSHYVMGGGGRITDIAVIAERMARVMPCGGCGSWPACWPISAGARIPIIAGRKASMPWPMAR